MPQLLFVKHTDFFSREGISPCASLRAIGLKARQPKAPAFRPEKTNPKRLRPERSLAAFNPKRRDLPFVSMERFGASVKREAGSLATLQAAHVPSPFHSQG